MTTDTHVSGRKALHGGLPGLLLLCWRPREPPGGSAQQVQLGLQVGDVGVRLGSVYGLGGIEWVSRCGCGCNMQTTRMERLEVKCS